MKKQMKNAWKLRGVLMCCLALMALTACGPSVQISENQSDSELFEQAITLYEGEEYGTALEYFLYVKENFLRSSYAGLTRFYAGQCYYELEKYDEATIEYKSFLAFFPGDPNAPEAQFKLGASLLYLARGAELDQATIQEALAEFKKVAENYPENEEYIQKTQDLLNEVKDKIATHEYLVAKFYRKDKRYSASNNRLLFLMRNYPATALYDDALFMAAQNYLDLDLREEGKKVLLELLDNYPDYEEREKARKKLVALGETYVPQSAEALEPVSEEAEIGEDVPQEEALAELPEPQPLETSTSVDAAQGIPEGYVVLLRGEQIFINLIHEDGIKKGMILKVLRDEQTVGSLRIVEVQEGFSICEVESLEGGMTVLEDDKVRVVGQ